MDNRDKHISGQDQANDMEYFEHEVYSPEMWAAKFGHLIGCGDLRKYTYENKSFEIWVHELFRILHSENLYTLRRKLLSAEEIAEIDKDKENSF